MYLQEEEYSLSKAGQYKVVTGRAFRKAKVKATGRILKQQSQESDDNEVEEIPSNEVSNCSSNKMTSSDVSGDIEFER